MIKSSKDWTMKDLVIELLKKNNVLREESKILKEKVRELHKEIYNNTLEINKALKKIE